LLVVDGLNQMSLCDSSKLSVFDWSLILHHRWMMVSVPEQQQEAQPIEEVREQQRWPTQSLQVQLRARRSPLSFRPCSILQLQKLYVVLCCISFYILGMPLTAGCSTNRGDMFERARKSAEIISKGVMLHDLWRERTSSAPFTDSSHRSRMNSSRAIDSLSTLIMRWHSCGKKNSISS
jgi:hypothetical protein